MMTLQSLFGIRIFHHSCGPAVRHSLKLKTKVLAGLVQGVCSPMQPEIWSGVRSMNRIAGATPGAVFQ